MNFSDVINSSASEDCFRQYVMPDTFNIETLLDREDHIDSHFLYFEKASESFALCGIGISKIFELGCGEEISIKELSTKIKNLIKFEGTLEFDNTKPDGNPRKLLDSTLINNLGWRSNINLDEGLELTFQWFEKNYKSLRK